MFVMKAASSSWLSSNINSKALKHVVVVAMLLLLLLLLLLNLIFSIRIIVDVIVSVRLHPVEVISLVVLNFLFGFGRRNISQSAPFVVALRF